MYGYLDPGSSIIGPEIRITNIQIPGAELEQESERTFLRKDKAVYKGYLNFSKAKPGRKAQKMGAETQTNSKARRSARP